MLPFVDICIFPDFSLDTLFRTFLDVLSSYAVNHSSLPIFLIVQHRKLDARKNFTKTYVGYYNIGEKMRVGIL